MPTLINRGYGKLFFWDGRVTSLEEQVLKPIQDPYEMDMTLTEASSASRAVGRRHLALTGELRALDPLGQRSVRSLRQW